MAPQPYQLAMRSGPNPGQIFDLYKNEIYLGRDVSNDIVINDPEVSRKHARITAQAGGYVLEDLGSTNGTYINGQRLMGPHMLRSGEVIMLGENVSLVIQEVYDKDATVISAPGPDREPSQPPPPRESYVPPVQQQQAPPPPPAFSGPPPQSQAAPYYQEPEETDNRRLLYIGCGVLVVLACVLVAGSIAFDTLNLYCTPPFDALFPCP